jgi:hypothetical protein
MRANREAHARGADLGLNEADLAFYDVAWLLAVAGHKGESPSPAGERWVWPLPRNPRPSGRSALTSPVRPEHLKNIRSSELWPSPGAAVVASDDRPAAAVNPRGLGCMQPREPIRAGIPVNSLHARFATEFRSGSNGSPNRTVYGLLSPSPAVPEPLSRPENCGPILASVVPKALLVKPLNSLPEEVEFRSRLQNPLCCGAVLGE